MDDKKNQSILQDAVEEKIPSSEIKLWPAIRASLVAGRKQSVQQGENMNSISSRRLSRLVLVTLAAGTFLTMALITPQGRAVAQTVLQFFRRAESNTFPLEPSQMPADPGATSVPTAEPPGPLLSIAEAEIQVGFDAAELPVVPEGFNHLGARVYANTLSIEYEVTGGGGNLIIMQSKEGFLQSDWDKVPAEAITPVQVNESDAEFAHGTFVVFPDATSATWNADASILRLRWVKDGIWFEMTKFGDVERIEYLDRDTLIELAESLTTDPFPLEVEDAEAQAAFDVLEPTLIPEGMTFLGASFDPTLEMVSLSFGYSDTERIILFRQQRSGAPDACDLCGLVGASASVHSVQIQGVPGEYAEGVWVLTNNGPVWRDDPYLKTIRWQKDSMAFELIYMGMDLDKDKLVAIAESMK